jgi:hypothetical protein
VIPGAEWRIQSSPFTDSIDLWIMRRLGDRREHVTAQFTVHNIDKHEAVEGPTLRMTQDEAQQLINGLWHAGFRPRDGAGSLAHVEAQQAHLADMRRLVFKDPPKER